MIEELERRLTAAYPEMVELRRHFHQYPEKSFEEVETPRMIASYLKELGLDVREHVGGRGVVATLIGGKPGKTVAFRADFDALPIQDEKDVPYRSTRPGVMHACGHDAHTAALLVFAKVLSSLRDEIPGTVVFIHQFAEELAPGGAKPMIEDDCLNGVDVIYGAHVWTPLRVGTIGYRSGAIMAASDRFELTIQGNGGHGAMPHKTIDALLIGAQLVTLLQHVISRQIDPLDAAVLTIGEFRSGNAFNVIADQSYMTGTVRTFRPDTQTQIIDAMGQMIEATCIAYGATADFRYERGYPAVINDERETKRLVECAVTRFGSEHVQELAPAMIGEDFSYYLQHIPGSFFFVGAGNSDIQADYPHHHPRFDIDERAMLQTTQLFAALLLSQT